MVYLLCSPPTPVPFESDDPFSPNTPISYPLTPSNIVTRSGEHRQRQTHAHEQEEAEQVVIYTPESGSSHVSTSATQHQWHLQPPFAPPASPVPEMSHDNKHGGQSADEVASTLKHGKMPHCFILHLHRTMDLLLSSL